MSNMYMIGRLLYEVRGHSNSWGLVKRHSNVIFYMICDISDGNKKQTLLQTRETGSGLENNHFASQARSPQKLRERVGMNTESL